MKKRIISIALVVVMVVVMIPATLITAVAAAWTGNTNGYDVYLSNSELTLDGVKDAVYENSEKIISAYCTNSSVYFEAYAVATATGIYFFVDVTDNDVDPDREATDALPNSDKFQLYTQISDGLTDGDGKDISTWGYQWEEFDYAHDASEQRKDKCKSSITDKGYTLEFFKPWSDYGIATLSLEKAKFYFGLQANNYVGETNNGIAYDNRACAQYWSSGASTNYQGHVFLMTKANLITEPKAAAAAPDNRYYTANVVDYADITFDGKMDEAYNFTGKISAGYAYAGKLGVDSDFDAYMLATEKGIYVFASILDDSLDKVESHDVRDGDKFQIALTLGDTYWQRYSYIDFDYVNGGRNYVTGNYGGDTKAIEQKITFWDNNKGWNIEIFIPFSVCEDTQSGNVGYSSGVLSQNDLVMKANIQVNNHTVLATDPKTGRATSSKVKGQVYDVPEAVSSWSTSSVNIPVKLARQEGFGQLLYASSITIDGVKDAGYGDASTAFVFDGSISTNVYNYGNCNHPLNTSGIAWVTVTDTGIYVYAEFTDTDIGAENQPDGLRLDVAFPLSGAHGYVGLGYAKDGHYTGSYTWESAAYKNIFWQISGGHVDDRLGWGRKDLGNGKYAIEMGLRLPHYEQELMKAGESFPIAIGLTYTDCCTTNNGSCHKIFSSYYWSYWSNATAYRMNMPRWTADKNVTAATTNAESTKIASANVVLDESINIKYTANVPATSLNNVMKFTFNDKVTYVQGTRTSDTTVEFMFEDLAPQCMDDNIKAELYVDGAKVDSVDEYSVKQNIETITAPEKNPSVDLKNLCDALLLYGAAAQNYTGYKTESPVADLGELDPSSFVWDIVSVKDVKNTADMAEFVAAGVRFANVNKLYVKVDNAENVKSLTVKVGDGAPVALELNDKGVAYTDAIKATEFGTVYTFELIDTNDMTAKLTYSVNSYIYAKTAAVGDVDSNIAMLTAALYNYGVAAEAYNAN